MPSFEPNSPPPPPPQSFDVSASMARVKALRQEAESRRLRTEVRQSMVAWSVAAGYNPAPHHELLISELELLESDDGPDTLLVFMPPGSAKSTYVNNLFPAWFIARNPDRNVITASHGAELAERWGRKTRNLVIAHGNEIGIALSEDSSAAYRWATTQGGEYYAVGVGVGIAGFRADLGIIDDPFGSREDAESRRSRDRVWDWYSDDFSTRLKPGSKRVIMHTRWHDDDLDRQGASAFAASCRAGDVSGMLWAADFLNNRTVDGWRLAMARVGRLSAVSPEVRAAFLNIWIESKHMPLQVGHRPTMARALQVLMPPIAQAEPLRLFRGTSASERHRRRYGFSWSTQRDIAVRFAAQASLGSGGAVLLETTAPIGSVHLRRDDEGYYDEGEVVVNPYALEHVEVVARFAEGSGVDFTPENSGGDVVRVHERKT